MCRMAARTTRSPRRGPAAGDASEVLLVQPEDGLLTVGQLVARLLERGGDHRGAWVRLGLGLRLGLG